MWKERNNCRLCGGAFEEVLDLGLTYPSEFVDEQAEQVKVPLTLVKCVDCDLVQLKHTVNQDKLYRQYWYRSSLNNSMVTALQNIVTEIELYQKLKPGDVLVDIGCNDGILFSLYSNREARVMVGFDPAKNLASEAKTRCDYFFNDYFTAAGYDELELPKASVVTSIAMFYDLEDPHSFIEDVASILADDGMWVIQMTDLVSMLEINAFDNISHEHLEYYSLTVLDSLLLEHRLEISHVEFNQVNGGSIRVYVHKECALPSWQYICALEAEENFFDSSNDPFKEFKERTEDIKRIVVGCIVDEVANGKTVAVMGASTKGNTLLQYFGLDDSLISHAAEINKEKFGKRTIGTNIPIIDEQYSLALHPDYYLILPWHFIDNFIERNMNYLKKGGKFIVPMPTPVVYYYSEFGMVEQHLL